MRNGNSTKFQLKKLKMAVTGQFVLSDYDLTANFQVPFGKIQFSRFCCISAVQPFKIF
jgi:hypothetical protein